jgi:hypothetical protein
MRLEADNNDYRRTWLQMVLPYAKAVVDIRFGNPQS